MALRAGIVAVTPLLAAALLTAGSPTTAEAAPDQAARAETTYAALQRAFDVGDGTGLVREQVPVATGDNTYSYEWPFSQVHAAALDLTGLPGARGTAHEAELAVRTKAQEAYWLSTGGTTGLPAYGSYVEPPLGQGGDVFYDDNEWVGLLDVQRTLMTGDQRPLTRAKQIFRLVVSGWDTDGSHADPGGVFWTQASWSQDRNTVSNMPGALLGLRLYQATHDTSYLTWATRMYEWTNTHLQRPDGLYADHVALDGTVEPTVWSYNQGVPIGVNVALYEVTKDRRYLREAQRIAAAAETYYGTVGLDAQPDAFNAIYFTNLLRLDAVTGSDHHRRVMASYAQRMWTQHRDPATGLFHFAADGSTQAIEQAAMVRIYAMLGWDRADWDELV